MRHPEKRRWRRASKPTATIAKSAAAKQPNRSDSTAPVSRLKLPPPVEQRFVDIERRLAALEGVCPMACPANCSKRCPMAVQS